MFRGLLITAAVLGLAKPGTAAEPFSPSRHLDWTVTAGRIKDDCASAKARGDSALHAVSVLDSSAQSFANTPGAIEAALDDFSDSTSGDAFLKDVAVSSSVRQAARDCQTLSDKYTLEVFNREDLYKAVKAYADKGEKLDGEDKKLLQKELLDFKRNGLALPEEERYAVKKAKDRLIEISQAFMKNVEEVRDFALFTRAELDGLPDDYIGRLERVGDRYKVTVDYPDFFPFMENARDPGARRRLESLFDNRAAKENLPLFSEALRLRAEAAGRLGYPSHAAYVLDDRMAKTPEKVEEFLDRLRSKLKPLGRAELKVLLELKKQDEGAKSDGVINVWDWRYYDNQLKKRRYQIDQEAIKEYFPLETVVSGMLGVYQRLLGLKFREVAGASVWHPDVKLYEITDAAGGEPLAYFYMDLFPREGKYKHAASFNIINGRLNPDGSYQKPVAAIVANFPKSTSRTPSLLKHGSHQDVETIFHEFGHIMHQTLTRARYERFSGANVAWDFVEAPSQMLENWVWDPEVLASLSGSYKDPAKKLPDELLKKMIAVRNVDTGLVQLRQAFFSEVDMLYHTEREVKDPTALYARLMRRISLIPMNPGTNPEASFGHLFDGYDAGYYGYLWSKVYAQDMFSRFEAEGLLNGAIGRQYRDEVLAPGGSQDEMGLVRKFLGREPNEEAFLRSIGLGRAKGT
ncbi:MAG: Zn-dependent oligopeptidase [Elusimicrobia bacterium]|nr:Zn-dependent oligopeptidase [Elusimicrobiota bacterium]